MEKETKIIQVTPSIGLEDSGPSYSVLKLFEEIGKMHKDVHLAFLDLEVYKSKETSNTHIFKTNFYKPLGISFELKSWLKNQAALKNNTIFHNHGMWQFNAFYTSWLNNRSTTKLVISPRGTLSKWSLSNGNIIAKKIFWRLFQKNALEAANCIHATSISEMEDIRRLGFKNPIAVIPNGIHFPKFNYNTPKEKTVLFLGRIHPKKGLEPLLKAWKDIEQYDDIWKLKIFGSDRDYYGKKSYKNDLIKQAKAYQLKRVEFFDPIYGDLKFEEYRKASIFILPTFSENFGMTVLEALSQKTPAIVSKGAPWKILSDTHSGWWINLSHNELVSTIKAAISTPTDQLLSMGENAYELAHSSFSWKSVGTDMMQVYDWINKPSLPVPKTVYLD